MRRDALFSEDGKRRFWLTRNWSPSASGGRVVNLVGLNPSKAGKVDDDPTIRKDIGFATRWGYDGIVMTNLNPIISTDPWGLPPWKGFDQENLRHVLDIAMKSDLVVCAWGSVPQAISRSIALPEYVHWFRCNVRRDLHCIDLTKDGSPAHPSRHPYTTSPQMFSFCVDWE